MLDLQEHPDGVLLPVQAVPRSSRTQIDTTVAGALRVRLAAPPVDGAANKLLVEVIATWLGVPKRNVELIAGQRGKRKTVLVRGVNAADVAARLESLAPG